MKLIESLVMAWLKHLALIKIGLRVELLIELWAHR